MDALHNSVFGQYNKRSSSSESLQYEYKRTRLDTKHQTMSTRKSERAKPKKSSSSECNDSVNTDELQMSVSSKLIVF